MTLLEGTFAKLDRADHHIASLYSEVQVWGGREPYSLTEHDSPEKTERVYRVKIDHPPDVLGWGVQVGDAIHNLRSALDALAWQAAGGDGKAPSWTEFPIFKDEARYLDTRRGGGVYKISGVANPKHRTLFEQCQPWRNPDGHERDALWMLHELDRIDKHRVVTPVFTVALKATGQVLVTYGSEEAARQADNEPPILKSPPQAPVTDGAEVLRILTPSPFVDMQMNSQVDLGVSLQYGDRPHRGGVHFLLIKMATRAREVAEQFRNAGL